ncbi:uncharacterized protein LOC133916307 [Phragmites australis]|uniref:uncharacterized protein LOC133916307 n=1 Tax=Phragmites australis TaxID=29695 RepID=UPI002D791AD7|nr:uncharacterized protein LOC133916307 [Phragmites australis]
MKKGSMQLNLLVMPLVYQVNWKGIYYRPICLLLKLQTQTLSLKILFGGIHPVTGWVRTKLMVTQAGLPKDSFLNVCLNMGMCGTKSGMMLQHCLSPNRSFCLIPFRKERRNSQLRKRWGCMRERDAVSNLFPPPTANQSWREVLSMRNLLNGHEPMQREIIFSVQERISNGHYSSPTPLCTDDEQIQTHRMYISGTSNDIWAALSDILGLTFTYV